MGGVVIKPGVRDLVEDLAGLRDAAVPFCSVSGLWHTDTALMLVPALVTKSSSVGFWFGDEAGLSVTQCSFCVQTNKQTNKQNPQHPPQ